MKQTIDMADLERLGEIEDALNRRAHKRGYTPECMPSFNETMPDLLLRVHRVLTEQFPGSTIFDITTDPAVINNVTKAVMDDWFKANDLNDRPAWILLQERGYRVPKNATQRQIIKLTTKLFDKMAGEVDFCLQLLALMRAATTIGAVNITDKLTIIIPESIRKGINHD